MAASTARSSYNNPSETPKLAQTTLIQHELKMQTQIPLRARERDATARAAFQLHLVPRFILEVSRGGSVCTAAATPQFFTDCGDLHVNALQEHVLERAKCTRFVGFTVSTLLESEDRATTLCMFPHVFSSRLVLFRPRDKRVLELCALASMVENADGLTLRGAQGIVDRARQLSMACKCADAAFLYRGIDTLVATLVHYFKLDPFGVLEWPSGLLAYRLHRELEYNCTEDTNNDKDDTRDAHGLLRSIYLNSHKMGERGGKYIENMTNGESYAFSLVYSDTILTAHYGYKDVLRIMREKCLYEVARDKLL
uniref:Tegument protein n=1 Tax=Otarine gammaherpesvirus 4 TaxID=2801541 RepID=A0A889IWL5_9GAMA|nr:Tegument protein [Otarine gammaherpesvirus 4]